MVTAARLGWAESAILIRHYKEIHLFYPKARSRYPAHLAVVPAATVAALAGQDQRNDDDKAD